MLKIKMKSIFYFLYLFFLTASCLFLAMEGAEAATYNFYFNNTEQGANSSAAPTLTVRDGKGRTVKAGNDTHTFSSAAPAEASANTAEGPDKNPLIPNPLPPAPWGKAEVKAAPAQAPAPATEVEEAHEFEDGEEPAFEPTTEYDDPVPASKLPRALPSQPKRVALDMTVPQLLSALFTQGGQ